MPRARFWSSQPVEESFGECLLPLTFSFARELMATTNLQLARELGVPTARIERNRLLLSSVLVQGNGQLAYDVAGWYRLVSLLPGMLSVPDRVRAANGGEAEYMPDSVADESALRDGIRWLGQRRRMWWFARTIERRAKRWRVALHHDLDTLLAPDAAGHPLAELDADGLVSRLDVLRGKVLATWGMAAVTDYLAGEAGERLTSLLTARHDDDVSDLHRQLTTGLDGIEAPHARELRLAGDSLDDWIARHGWLSPQELQLDATTYADQPELARQLHAATAARPAEQAQRPPLGRQIDRSARTVRRLLAERERMRHDRARVFAVARGLARTLGERLVEAGMLQQAGDVHFAELDELVGAVRGTTTSVDLAAIVALRGAPRSASETLSDGGDTPGGELRGRGGSGGVASGLARIAHGPADLAGCAGMVVVCRLPDPGWMPLLAGAAALVCERGSELSHAAIVARENGMPAVFGVAGALQLVGEGELLHVDGTTGTVDRGVV